MGMQPEEFIDQINRKQMPAFRELFGSFYRYLVLYAMRYVRQQEVSEDIVQEVFIAIWEDVYKRQIFQLYYLSSGLRGG